MQQSNFHVLINLQKLASAAHPRVKYVYLYKESAPLCKNFLKILKCLGEISEMCCTFLDKDKINTTQNKNL
jgi:hypothetical protein